MPKKKETEKPKLKQMILDKWQEDFLKYRGHSVTCTGRRVGKTYIHARKACERMLEKPNTRIVVASLTEDQAILIILFAMNYLEQNNKAEILKKQTFTNSKKITLKNGSQMMARPVGNTGDAIRGFEGDVLILDEVSRFNELILEAATPILLTTGGEIWMCSTPHGKQGFFWRAYQNKDNRYRVFETDTEKTVYNRPISESWTEEQREKAIKFLEQEKAEKTELQYGQEYLGLFMEDLQRFFSEQLINQVCILTRQININKNSKNYLGCDIARMGNDQGTYEIISDESSKFWHRESIVTKKQLTTETERKISEMAQLWNVRKIGIDAGSGTLGVSVLDHLMQTKIKHKLIALNNRQISLDDEGDKTQRIMKEDLYFNLKSMLEHGDLLLLNDEDVRLSLASVQYEFSTETGSTTKLRIFGNYTHIAEGLIRAAWLAKKEKSLNLWAY